MKVILNNLLVILIVFLFCFLFFIKNTEAFILEAGGIVTFTLPCVIPPGVWAVVIKPGTPRVYTAVHPYPEWGIAHAKFHPVFSGVSYAGKKFPTGGCLIPCPPPAFLCPITAQYTVTTYGTNF